jgi:hypothetical protein
MAFTLSDIATKVKQRVRDTGYNTQEIYNYINDTINDVYNEYNLPFMEDEQVYTLTVGDPDITSGAGLPANYVQAINLTIDNRVLEPIDIRQLENYSTFNSTDGNQPTAWYKFEGTINLTPTPPVAQDVKVRYYKKPTVINDDNDVPEFPSQFEEILVSGAAYRVLQVKDNYDQAAVHQNKYDENLLKMVVRYSQSQVGTPTLMRINRRHVGKTSY